MMDNIGKSIAEHIGNVLVGSGVLDGLVKKGYEPDYTDVFIYNHHHAWLFGKSIFDAMVDVEAGKRKVHHVRRDDRDVGYLFEFVDEPDILYRTNYAWSFVFDTPENVKKLEMINENERLIEVLRATSNKLRKGMSLSTEYDG